MRKFFLLTAIIEILEGLALFFDAEKIPTHGGSLRIYSSKKKIKSSERMKKIIFNEKKFLNKSNIKKFTQKVHQSKYKLLKLLEYIKSQKKNIYAIGAPSRASTLINFVGLDNYTIEYILEKKGSYKIDKLMPGTNIPVIDEKIIKKSQPDYLLILSWHISKDLIKIFKKNGFRGKFIVPLPYPKVI